MPIAANEMQTRRAETGWAVVVATRTAKEISATGVADDASLVMAAVLLAAQGKFLDSEYPFALNCLATPAAGAVFVSPSARQS